MSAPVSILTMFSQSMTVISQPSVATFERFEKSGTAVHAAIYVGLYAVVAGLFGLSNGLLSVLSGILSTLVGFFIFTGLVYAFGKHQGGSGTFDEVAYTFSLFYGPLAALFSLVTVILILTCIGIVLLPILVVVAIGVNIYFAYLAVQSSMNLRGNGRTWMTLIGAGVATIIFQMIISWTFRLGAS